MKESNPPRSLAFSQQCRAAFYVLTPNESSFRSVEEVPDYVDQATPLFLTLIFLEFVIKWAQKGHSSAQVNDGIASLSAGYKKDSWFIWMLNLYLFCSNLMIRAYITLFFQGSHNFCFLFGISEINLLWAGHQTHHSSEYYNLFTALRQSVLQKYTSWIFYLPLAFFIPPSVYAVHLQFNLLYQFWIHTEVISNLGPLEFILNTPSHHRVHHGRNPYCIDKNYGGTLIIWDRIFGTFAAEKDKVIYGLTHPINTFELFKIQFHHCVHIGKTFWNIPGFCNKLSVIFKGPGWEPGKPRLGLLKDIPEITGKEVPFSLKLPSYLRVYAVIHFVLMLGFYIDLFASKSTLSQVTLLMRVGYIILTLTSIGFLMEQRPEAGFLEFARCSTFLAFHKFGYLKTYIPLLSIIYEVISSMCILIWPALLLGRIKHLLYI
uniref:Alkylglycerol monooxygenase n=1 Tax=Anolis carolinensis TaxID=28377 RepID=G1KW78_ANOCA